MFNIFTGLFFILALLAGAIYIQIRRQIKKVRDMSLIKEARKWLIFSVLNILMAIMTGFLFS